MNTTGRIMMTEHCWYPVAQGTRRGQPCGAPLSRRGARPKRPGYRPQPTGCCPTHAPIVVRQRLKDITPLCDGSRRGENDD